MKISENGLNLIKQFEGCYLTAYKCSAGVWTIGWGTTSSDKAITGTSITQGMKITQATADKWLEESVNSKYAPLVDKYNAKYNFNQNQFDALVSFAYNVGGIEQLTKNGSRSISEIAEHMLAYNKAGGKVLAGLTRRRQAEKDLFSTPVAIVQSVDNTYRDIFDADLYNLLYKDLQKAYKNNANELYNHFVGCGANEGRIASFVFDVDYYINKYDDIRQAYSNKKKEALLHFLTHGINECRVASKFFDINVYYEINKDVKEAFKNDNKQAMLHFIRNGMSEGRVASNEFNVRNYRKNYGDLNEAFKDDWKQYFKHYIVNGRHENRVCV